MKTPLMALVLSAAALMPAHAAMTADECTAAWTSADLNGDGTLDSAESARYVAALRVADRPLPDDGLITQPVFLESCTAGYFDVAAVEAGAPFEGANSFTEGQAQDRALAAGYTDVSALTQDDAGIWRGTATADGTAVNIAVDYKGNVVATNR
jgi:hypothetical protein